MLESDSPKEISLHEGTQWEENHKSKTRARNIPTPPQRRRGWEWRAECRKSSYRIAWSISLLQAPHTSCWWCHLLQPSAGCFLWVAFPEAACSPCRTRSGHSSTLPSLDLLPATVSPLHLSISYRAISSQDDTASVRRPILHWSLAVQVRAAVNPTYDRPSEVTAFRT